MTLVQWLQRSDEKRFKSVLMFILHLTLTIFICGINNASHRRLDGNITLKMEPISGPHEDQYETLDR
jgi:hypothetical protein